MSQITRLTNNSDETDIASLISKDNIFSIPYFQRPYKWKSERINKLQDDILSLVDESSDFHFLGAVIVHGRRTNPSDPDVFDVIDGQQRLTTIFLMLCATVKTLIDHKEYDEASAIFLKYIAINRNLNKFSNSRLHSCKEDRAQLNYVIRDLLSDEKFKTTLGSFKFRQLPISADTKNKGALRTNYNSMLRFFKYESELGGIERVRTIYVCLLNKISVVQIDIKDPASGPTIFDSLNSRQEPMTIGDLVRNGIFSRVADQEPDEIEQIDTDHWQPFYKSFEKDSKNYFDNFFFPYGLIKNPNLRKSDIYNSLQSQWSDENDPANMISQLNEFQDPFMDLVTGENRTGHSKVVANQFKNLFSLGLPSSSYPFLMRLSRECKIGHVSDDVTVEILFVVESFLVRRAACGIEPTGLHAVFKRLWNDIASNVCSSNAKKAISDHRTVAWPNNADFKSNIENRELYGAAITPFLLKQFDISLGGDSPDTKPWVEHVLPQKPSQEWFEIYSKDEHEKLKDTLANLIPLTSQMNIELGNKPYANKRESYRKDSMYKSTRDFADTNVAWEKEQLFARRELLSKWALQRWDHNRA